MRNTLVNRLAPESAALAGAMVRVMVYPAVIVAGGSEVIAANTGWLGIAGQDEIGDTRPLLSECLAGFSGAEALVSSLKAGGDSIGVLTLLGPATSAGDAEGRAEYVVRWRQIDLSHVQGACAVIVFEDRAEIQHLVSAVHAQRIRIDQLLIRQTMIEEQERRRIGRALHDGVAQTLAHLRNLVAHGDLHPEASEALTSLVDEVIDSIRTLTFELSPPILEDLGLLPAIAWLVDHLAHRYQVDISLASDEKEPALSRTAKTILFRAVRELAINAAKHAPKAEITVTCESDSHRVRVTVRDTGPGFNPRRAHRQPAVHQRFGLLSVEQQLRGIGGTFDFYSAPGEGTRAAIIIPFDEPARVALEKENA